MSDKRQIELASTTVNGARSVVYVMSRDQRVRDNHALLAAQAEALEHELPLVVVFNLYETTGDRRREHYEFMVEGLKEVEKDLRAKDIPFVVTIGSMQKNIAKLASDVKPRTIYFDFSPLRGPRTAQKKLARTVDCRVVVVDTHNIIPVWVTSDKEEFAAHTIRRKIHRNIEAWCEEPATLKKHPHSLEKVPKGASWSDIGKVVESISRSGIRHDFNPGEAAAKRALKRFIDDTLETYARDRNDAMAEAQSDLSPYLHYGQLSALRIVLEIMNRSSHLPHIFHSLKMPTAADSPTKADSIDSFVEELVVRKELSDNFCLHNPHYDSLYGAKDWAKESLNKHKDDPREHVYTYEQLEKAETHDELWNAAQKQLTKSGKIHGYMRMYWAKQFLAWTESPATAVKWAIRMNDTYHLDGGDPNGYVGVMWSIAGVHDRPWFERDVYGKIRYMARSGSEKKFDVTEYIAKWS